MLEGLTVVSVESYYSAPLASRLLADLGAEVVKVENPNGGDPYRHVNHYYDGDTPEDLTFRFMQINRGKKSVELDLKSDAGQAAFESLVEAADVVIENLRPGTMERFGLDYDELTRVNEELIYCSISGYGHTGPKRNEPSFDASIQAVSGIIRQNVANSDEFGYSGVFIADIVSGIYAAFAIQSAYIAKLQGNGGTHVDVSMLDCMLSLFNIEIAEYSATGTVTPRLQSTVLPFNVYETSDGAVVLSLFSNDNWDVLCRRLGLDDWIQQYDSMESRQNGVQTIDETIETVLQTEPTDHWEATFSDTGIKVIPVNSVEDAFSMEQVRERDVIKESHHSDIGTFQELAFPVKFSNHALEDLPPAPNLGEHTDQVLNRSSEQREFQGRTR